MGSRRVVVFDANTFVSSVGWKGQERELITRCLAGEVRVGTSSDLLAELERVLRYAKLRFDETLVRTSLEDLLAIAEVVEIEFRLDVIPDDPTDNRVLECAVTIGAHWIVSGDKHLLRIGTFQGIDIITTAEALRRLDSEQRSSI